MRLKTTYDKKMRLARFLRRASQLIFLGLFLYLMSRNRYPLSFPAPTDFFLRIDPLSGISVMLAGRELALRFWPAAVTIVTALIWGRFFCGWVCPLGTALDISDGLIKAPMREKKARIWHHYKYMILILILTGAVFSFQFIFFLDPLVIITRTTVLTLLPIAYYLSEGALVNLSMSPVIGNLFISIYSNLKGSVFPVQEEIFRQGLPVLAIFIGIILLEKVTRRFWCRYLCPLGGLLGIISKISFFGRRVGTDCNKCKICSRECKMGTIRADFSSSRAECILCLNCYFSCPEEDIHFNFHIGRREDSRLDLSRRRFIGAAACGLGLMGLYRTSAASINAGEKAIRPPGAVEEAKFLDLCLRCQQCVGICSTTGGCLQPAAGEAGLEGLWTPVGDMRTGYCEFNCNLCGQVCPSGAIKLLEIKAKQQYVMGLAFFDVSRCIPYYKGENCLVCQEHCPTADKAIKFNDVVVLKSGVEKRVKLPYVEEKLCIGCGICEYKCPIAGQAGIFVTKSKVRNMDI